LAETLSSGQTGAAVSQQPTANKRRLQQIDPNQAPAIAHRSVLPTQILSLQDTKPAIMALNGSTLPDSIYVALDARPNKDEYVSPRPSQPDLPIQLLTVQSNPQHWAIVTTTTHNAPTLSHASNLTGPWQFLTRPIRRSSDFSMALIVLVKVGTIVKNDRDVATVIQQVLADGEPSKRTGEAFTCRVWVKDALAHLAASGSAVLEGDVGEWAFQSRLDIYLLMASRSFARGNGQTVCRRVCSAGRDGRGSDYRQRPRCRTPWL
jgi:hypothetical protein